MSEESEDTVETEAIEAHVEAEVEVTDPAPKHYYDGTGEKQGDREAVDRMTKRLLDGNARKQMSPEQARDIAIRAARRCGRGKLKQR